MDDGSFEIDAPNLAKDFRIGPAEVAKINPPTISSRYSVSFPPRWLSAMVARYVEGERRPGIFASSTICSMKP